MAGSLKGVVDTGNRAVAQASPAQKTKSKLGSDFPLSNQFAGMLQFLSGQGTMPAQQAPALKKQGLMTAKASATPLQGAAADKGKPGVLLDVQGSIAQKTTAVKAASVQTTTDFTLQSPPVGVGQNHKNGSSTAVIPGTTRPKNSLLEVSNATTTAQQTLMAGTGAATNLPGFSIPTSSTGTNSPGAGMIHHTHSQTHSPLYTSQLGQQALTQNFSEWNAISSKLTQANKMPQTAVPSGKVSGTQSNSAQAGQNESGILALQMSGMNGNISNSSTVAGSQQPTLNLAQGQTAVAQQLGSWIIQQANVGPQQVQVQVAPQGMGSIVISVTHDAGGVNVQLEASAMQTVQWLQQTAPQVMDAVKSSGLNVTGFNVSFGQANLSRDNSGRQTPRREIPTSRLRTSGVSSLGNASRDGPLEQAWDLLSHRISVRI